ncbi:hypothetical protein CLS_03470 [[Clostridium] cf. saccharolyticum K10]|nr:hypothetical protein CLS_03470 [[Clostridium] cf. saccharolyticum K10]
MEKVKAELAAEKEEAEN